LNWVNKTDLYIASGLTLSQTNTTYGKTPLIINQKDVDESFIQYNGTFDNFPPVSSNLTTYAGSGTVTSLFGADVRDYGWQWEGMLKMKVSDNAQEPDVKFLAFYSWYVREE